jgi:FMN phosphatase YigB (HAD superfamily)
MSPSPLPADHASVDAVLFDLGGVLVEIDFQRVFAHWARSAGVPTATVAGRFSFDASYEAHEVGAIDAAQYFAALRGTLGLELTDEQFQAGWCSIFGGEMPGAAGLLASLAGRVPMHVFSNTNAAHHAWWAERFATLLAPIGQVLCSHELGLRKPTRAGFDAVCERIGAAPGRVLFFDDTEANVAGAREAGLQAFHVGSVAAMARILDAASLPSDRWP